jgi:tetratricopeptide (TPR) repeat protein
MDQQEPITSENLLNYARELFKNRRFDEAFDTIEEAKNSYPENMDVLYTYHYISRYLGRDQRWGITLGEESADRNRNQAELFAVVEKVREKMSTKVDGFFAQMKDVERRRDEFLSPMSLLDDASSFLLILRKWNSYTPIIPAEPTEHCVGGGYFISHKGKGIVIDPGYDFIENFHRAGGRITDIDIVILTHAHGDHTNDFEALLSLLYQYNRKNKATDHKQIDVYANLGSIMKLSGILDLRGMDYINRVHVFTPGQKYDVCEGVLLEPLQANHDELVTKKYAVGLKFVFSMGDTKKTVIITSDTGLFPIDGFTKKGEAKTQQSEIWQEYPPSGPIDLLIAHLGSMKEHEFRTDIYTNPDGVFYPNHLGVLGTVRVITALRPTLAVVSEFGEELSSCQEDLITMMSEIVREYCTGEGETIPKVLPGDLPFIYDINTGRVHCTLTNTMVPVGTIQFGLPESKGNKRFYYYDERETRNLAKLHERSVEFEARRQKLEGLYFKR